MKNTIGVANHLSPHEVRTRMQEDGAFFRVLKWLVVYNALVDPRPIHEIAKHTGLSEGTVHRVLAEYNAHGPESFESRPKTVVPLEKVA